MSDPRPGTDDELLIAWPEAFEPLTLPARYKGAKLHGYSSILDSLHGIQRIFDLTAVLFQPLRVPSHRPEERFLGVGVLPTLRQLPNKRSLSLQPFASEGDALRNLL